MLLSSITAEAMLPAALSSFSLMLWPCLTNHTKDLHVHGNAVGRRGESPFTSGGMEWIEVVTQKYFPDDKMNRLSLNFCFSNPVNALQTF